MKFQKERGFIMTLEELIAEIDGDLAIDRSQLDLMSIQTPTLINKYLKILMQERLNLRKYQNMYEEKRKDAWLYYTGKANAEVYKDKPFDLKVMKGDLDRFILSDKDLNNVSMKTKVIEEKVKYLEEVLKTLHNRGFQIKNAIDWMRLTTGPN